MTAQISASQVKALREATNAGMMDCKKALQETDGDFDAAVTLLREKGIAKAGKLAGRATSEGRVGLAAEGTRGALVGVGCNTDFVAKNDDFAAFVDTLARHALDAQPADRDELLASAWPEGGGTVEEVRTELSASTGENVEIRDVFVLEAEGVLGAYQHGTKIGVLVQVAGPDEEKVRTFAADVAMHIAAARPRAFRREDIDQSEVDAEREIFVKQAEDKPEQIRGKIADGKLAKWFGDIVLLEQTWIFAKDRLGKDVTISEYAEMVGTEVGAEVKVTGYAHIELGA